MLIVIPVCHKDVEICLQNLDWIAKLDPMPYPYTAAVSHDSGFDATKVIELAKQRFANVIECRYPPWRGQPQAWPGPQNWAWQETARWVEACPKENWLWWEQDAVPVRSGWLKDIVTEYRKANKPFMGHIVENFDGHMNGVGCYPYNLSKFSVEAFLCRKIAFDIVLGPSVKNNVHKANHLFVHCPGSEPFTFESYEATKVVPKDCALFHRCKDGSLIKRFLDKKHRKHTVRKPSTTSKTWLLQFLLGWRYADGSYHIQTQSFSKEAPRLVHCLERHRTDNKDAIRRSLQAQESWLPHYSSGRMIPAHVWHYPRSSSDIGDKRGLPYLKDILLAGLNTGGKDDIVLWTNDDTILHSQIPDIVSDSVLKYGAIASFRVNFDQGKIPPLTIPYQEIYQLALSGQKVSDNNDLGRDVFGFRKDWLRQHWYEIPDMFLGELEFDLVISYLIRKHHGVVTTKKNMASVMPGCEIPRGYVLHERHARGWTDPRYEKSPPKLHNRNLATAFYADNGMHDFITT